jgi:hypothetical protein
MSNFDKSELNKFRQKYRSIGSVKCPAFSNEPVFFGRTGFYHLIRKGRKLRENEVQLDRLELLRFAPYILAISKSFEKFTKLESNSNPSEIKFWSFIRYGLIERKITVVVRQIGNGAKEFYSIFA